MTVHNPLAENYLGGPLSSADGYAFPASAILDGLCPTPVVNAETVVRGGLCQG